MGGSYSRAAKTTLPFRKEGFFSYFKFDKKVQDSLLGLIHHFSSKRHQRNGYLKIFTLEELENHKIQNLNEIKRRYTFPDENILQP